MKKSNYSFFGTDIMIQAEISRNNTVKVFDWDKAAHILKRKFAEHPDLIAEAGLQNDWEHTGGCIFAEGGAIISEYTYLSSTWAMPTLILSWDGKEQEEIECFTQDENTRFGSDSKWDDVSLKILECEIKLLSE